MIVNSFSINKLCKIKLTLLQEIIWVTLLLQLSFIQILAFDWQKIMDVFQQHRYNGTVPKKGIRGPEVMDMFNDVQNVLKKDPELWNWVIKKAEQLKEKRISPFDAGLDLFKEFKEFMKGINKKEKSKDEEKSTEKNYNDEKKGIDPDIFVMIHKAKLDDNDSKIDKEKDKSEISKYKNEFKTKQNHEFKNYDNKQETGMNTQQNQGTSGEYNKNPGQSNSYHGYSQYNTHAPHVDHPYPPGHVHGPQVYHPYPPGHINGPQYYPYPPGHTHGPQDYHPYPPGHTHGNEYKGYNSGPNYNTDERNNYYFRNNAPTQTPEGYNYENNRPQYNQNYDPIHNTKQGYYDGHEFKPYESSKQGQPSNYNHKVGNNKQNMDGQEYRQRDYENEYHYKHINHEHITTQAPTTQKPFISRVWNFIKDIFF